MDVVNKIVITAFLVIGTVFVIKNFSKNLCLNVGLILALLFNILLHMIYANTSPFLYSMHFVYLIFILIGINCLYEDFLY